MKKLIYPPTNSTIPFPHRRICLPYVLARTVMLSYLYGERSWSEIPYPQTKFKLRRNLGGTEANFYRRGCVHAPSTTSSFHQGGMEVKRVLFFFYLPVCQYSTQCHRQSATKSTRCYGQSATNSRAPLPNLAYVPYI